MNVLIDMYIGIFFRCIQWHQGQDKERIDGGAALYALRKMDRHHLHSKELKRVKN